MEALVFIIYYTAMAGSIFTACIYLPVGIYKRFTCQNLRDAYQYEVKIMLAVSIVISLLVLILVINPGLACI